MRVIMSINASAREIGEVLRVIRDHCTVPKRTEVITHDGRIAIEVNPVGTCPDREILRTLPGVESIEDTVTQFPLVSGSSGTANGDEKSGMKIKIPFSDVEIGGNQFVVMAGPCSIENEEFLYSTAVAAKKSGAKILRGGAFKPRTSPYSFQGLGEEGLKILAKVREEVGIAVVTEAMEPGTVDMVCEVADIVQVGSRNMQNFPLLKAVGRQSKPVLLKRGMSATVEEWLSSAEYIFAEGNTNVILCERGIRTFSTHSRHTLDIAVIPALRELTPLPVIIDPSHATGNASRVPPMAKASLAAGADGLLIEIHPEPSKALSDGFQALNLDEFRKLMTEIELLSSVTGREFAHL